MVENKFNFKSNYYNYKKEESDIKNNTIREIDLDDERFTGLIYWMEKGFNDGDVTIHIQESDNYKVFFERNIRDITIWNNLMIITWKPVNKSL